MGLIDLSIALGCSYTTGYHAETMVGSFVLAIHIFKISKYVYISVEKSSVHAAVIYKYSNWFVRPFSPNANFPKKHI